MQPPPYPPPPAYPPGPDHGWGPPQRSGIGVGGVLAIVFAGTTVLSLLGMAGFAVLYVKAKGEAHRASAAATTRSAPSPSDQDDDRTTSARPSLPSVTRHVPTHPLEILAGCSSGDVVLIGSSIGDAIEVGAPAYNQGDFAGCYETYRSTAATIEGKLPKGCSGPARALAAGRARARTLPTASEQAWAMRDAFDGLLEVMHRAGARGTGM
jgi:hypothetical protein